MPARDGSDESSADEPRGKKARIATTDDRMAGGGAAPPSTVLAARPMPVAEAEPATPGAAGVPEKSRHYPLIVILDQAALETVKNKKGVYELLSCDDRDLCKKLRKDPNEYRPDILHQELLALLDSPLNKAGLLKVYVQTKRRVLIDVNSSIRIPRTYKRFAGLMTQLLHKLKVKAGSESTTLLKVVKNPVSQYLPAGTRCYGFSCQGTLYRPMALARALLPDRPGGSPPPVPTCFVVGAMATGHVTIDDHPYIERMISVSEYPLSGAAALSRLVGAAEERWGIA
jgi:rRNA small subunit pseudouridine methyltransferase Nep1